MWRSIPQQWHRFPGEAFDLLDSIRPAGDHELEGEVVNANFSVWLEGFYQLFGGAAQVAWVLGDWLVCHFYLAAAC